MIIRLVLFALLPLTTITTNYTIEGSGFTPEFSQDPTTNDTDGDSLLTTTKVIVKRAMKVFYNGQVDFEFFSSFDYNKPRVPTTAVMALGRPLQKGESKIPQTNYIALWTPRGDAPHWGAVYLNSQNKLDAYFVKNKKLVTLSSPEMANIRVRLLQYVGTPTENNFKFTWVKSIDADMNTVVAEKQYGNLCAPRLAPAVYQAHGYEFLGEADIDSRVMYYVDNGHIYTINGNDFTNNVLLLVKERCQCSCF